MRAVLYAVQPYELHGTLYYALRYLVDGQEELREARISRRSASTAGEGWRSSRT